jgi:hypothetical protein
MSTILNKTPAIRLFSGSMCKLPEITALEIAQALRAADIILSAETEVIDTGVYKLHDIKYAGADYSVGVPYGFDALMQYTYDYLKDGHIVDMLLV